MPVAKLFRNFAGAGSSGSTGNGSASVITQSDTVRRLEVLDDFEHAGIGWLWATDAEARLIYISENAAEKLNRPINDLLAQPLTALFETDNDNQAERSNRPLNFQLTARNKIVDQTVRFALNASQDDGRQTWWSISGHPKFDKSGNFQG